MAAMTVAPDGTTWFLLQEGVAKVPKGAGQPTLTPIHHDPTANQIVVDAHGEVWINKYFPGADRFAPDGALISRCMVPNADFAAIPFLLDREGNVWTGTVRCRADGTMLASNYAGAAKLLAANGQIVAYAGDELVWLTPAGEIAFRVPTTGMLTSFALDGDDRVWAYDQAGKRLLRADRTRVEVVQEKLPADIRVMRSDSRGKILALDADFRLYRLGEGEALTSLPADNFYLDHQDRIWVADGKQARVYEAPTPD
jgi:streptogramin lyase